MATMTANTENPNKTFTQVLQKHAGRAKERLMQNLGRADKTKDEVFEVYLQNFSRQQIAATKLQKEFKNYLLCIRSMQMASKSLMDTLSEICEQEWVGHEQIPIKAQALDLLWDDYFRKMSDVLNPINAHINQFQETRNKIGKRGRKLVDYDKSRHNVESLRNSAKKKDDVKLSKAREELEQAKQLYEQINNELHDDLPRLYDSRIPFLVKNLQTLFDSECRFHGENAVVYQFLNETMHKLAKDSGHPISGNQMAVAPKLNLRPPSPIHPPSSQQSPQSQQSQKSPTTRNSFGVTSSPGGEVRPYEEIDFKKNEAQQPSSNGAASTPVSMPRASSGGMNGQKSPQSFDQGVYDIPTGATTTNLPPGTLYKVRATYKYVAEDVDELNFESGEVIRVIEYEDPEEQEEGWLMGVKETTGEKGLFPANFTRPI